MSDKKKVAKKSTKKATGEKRKAKRSDGVAFATAKRVLKTGMNKEGGRASDNATTRAIKIIESKLKELGEAARAAVLDRRAKTVSLEILKKLNTCDDVWKKLVRAPPTDKKDYLLAEAPVIRVFKKGLGKDMRIADEAKIVLLYYASLCMMNLGKSAGSIVEARKGKTISEKDILIVNNIHSGY